MASKKTIGKGKNKRYIVRYDDPSPYKRKQKQKTFKSSKEADEFIAHVTLQSNGKEDFLSRFMVPPTKQEEELKSGLLFKDYAENWYNVDFYNRVRPGTYKARGFYLRNHILPFFGPLLLEEVDAKKIQEFYALKKREGYATKTISSLHKFLSSLLQSAVDEELLVAHPMHKIKKKPKDTDRIADPWTYEEWVQFLGTAEQDGTDTMYDFAGNTGLRQGEVFALPWFNVDLATGAVTVTRSVSYDESGKPELFPKSKDSYRTIALPEYLITKLKKHKEEQMRVRERIGDEYPSELDLVFPNLHGGFLDPSNVRRQFYRLIQKAGVRKITFHDLRHMHASLLIKLGAQPKVVMGRLGHRDVETTIRYYSHLYPNADQEAIVQLETELLKHKQALHSPDQM